MDNNKLIEYIKNAPNEIKNALIGVLVNASVGMSKVENNLLKNNDETGNSGDKMQINNIKSNLLASMKRGEMNEQYVKHYYNILEKAEFFMQNTSKSEIQSILENHGMLLTEDGNNSDIYRYLNNSKSFNKREINNTTKPVEVTIKNNVFLKDQYDTNPNSNSYNTTIKCSYDRFVNNRIELYTDTLKSHITNGNGRILDFYIMDEYPIEQMISDFESLNGLSFVTNYGKKYSYIVKDIIGNNKQSNYIIVSFNGYVIQNV